MLITIVSNKYTTNHLWGTVNNLYMSLILFQNKSTFSKFKLAIIVISFKIAAATIAAAKISAATIVAVAIISASLVITVCYMLSNGSNVQPQGRNFFGDIINM